MKVRIVMFPLSDDRGFIENVINGEVFSDLNEFNGVVEGHGLHMKVMYTPDEFALGYNMDAFNSDNLVAAVYFERI